MVAKTGSYLCIQWTRKERTKGYLEYEVFGILKKKTITIEQNKNPDSFCTVPDLPSPTPPHSPTSISFVVVVFVCFCCFFICLLVCLVVCLFDCFFVWLVGWLCFCFCLVVCFSLIVYIHSFYFNFNCLIPSNFAVGNGNGTVAVLMWGSIIMC